VGDEGIDEKEFEPIAPNFLIIWMRFVFHAGPISCLPYQITPPLTPATACPFLPSCSFLLQCKDALVNIMLEAQSAGTLRRAVYGELVCDERYTAQENLSKNLKDCIRRVDGAELVQ
jgi:hypothetical protein